VAPHYLGPELEAVGIGQEKRLRLTLVLSVLQGIGQSALEDGEPEELLRADGAFTARIWTRA